MNVLEIVQRFTNAVGISEPSTAVANQAEDVAQIVELLNQEGRALSARHMWQALTYEASFTTVATESQGTLTTIIGATQQLRRIVNDTIWDRTSQVPILGPLSSQRWQAQKSSSLSGPYSEYRIRGNTLRFDPAPTAGHTCYFDYVSKCWCTDATGVTFRTNVAADTDLMILDDEVALAGLEWRWLRKKGLSYAEEFATYEGLVSDLINRDGTKAKLRMDERPNSRSPGVFVPVGSWPL